MIVAAAACATGCCAAWVWLWNFCYYSFAGCVNADGYTCGVVHFPGVPAVIYRLLLHWVLFHERSAGGCDFVAVIEDGFIHKRGGDIYRKHAVMQECRVRSSGRKDNVFQFRGHECLSKLQGQFFICLNSLIPRH